MKRTLISTTLALTLVGALAMVSSSTAQERNTLEQRVAALERQVGELSRRVYGDYRTHGQTNYLPDGRATSVSSTRSSQLVPGARELVLTDGSFWTIPPTEANIVLRWALTDRITVYLNGKGAYPYTIYNETRREYVTAALVKRS
ncbi:MAG TPA: hypothetical protein VM328_05345 [Fimbriimonadaceae bacterium]|nr:hypothetical protein [Fimbriimonadaceae bacterium]